MASFHEVVLPDTLAYGAKFGPSFKTTIVKTESGAEQRLGHWGRARRMGTVGFSIQGKAQMDALYAFFLARMGCLCGFRYSDQNDRVAVLEPLVNLGGTLLQLQKTYSSGGVSSVRLITKPSLTTPAALYKDGAAMTGGYTVDTTTGIVTLSAAAPASAFTWSGQFDTPVRFDTDSMEMTRDSFDSRSWSGIPIIELL